jgi:hypothetical protein
VAHIRATGAACAPQLSSRLSRPSPFTRAFSVCNSPCPASQCLCHDSNFTQNMEALLHRTLSVTTHRVIDQQAAACELGSSLGHPVAPGTYSRLVSLATLPERDAVCATPALPPSHPPTHPPTLPPSHPPSLPSSVCRVQEPGSPVRSPVAVFS